MPKIDKKIFLQVVHPALSAEHYARLHEKLSTSIPLSLDSRAMEQDCIFFAIKGELHDGHNFVKSALQNGALCAVVQKHHALLSDLPAELLIVVDDPLACFSELAHLSIMTNPATRIALTGSNGKTTTKEMIKAALSAVVGADSIFASPGNKNNHIGLPLSALELSEQHHYAIFEMGMNHAQEISHLCTIAEPQFGLITNISHAHEGNFIDGIDGVQKAKAELFESLKQGHAIINLDDNRIVKEANSRSFKATTTYGWSEQAHVRMLDVEAFNEQRGSQILRIAFDNQEITVHVPLAGMHHATNALAALAVVKALNLDVAQAATGLMTMKITDGRMKIIKNARGATLVDDGYNANPSSMHAGILAVQNLSGKRYIAVIGAMGELGASSSEHHFRLGQLLAEHFDYLFVCGKDAEPVVEGALKTGFTKDKIVYEKSSADLIKPLKELLKKDDVVYIKGSFSSNMQIVAQELSLLS